MPAMTQVIRGGAAYRPEASRGGFKAQQRNLRRDEESVGRAPKARAWAHIQPEPPMAVKPPAIAVDEAHDEAEGEELAAVRVPRQLKIEARGLRLQARFGPVREEYF